MSSHDEPMMQLPDKADLIYEDIIVLKELTIEIPSNQITCIVGPSGCGKTSILNLVAGLQENASNQTHKTDEQIGYIFQEDRLLPWMSAYDNIAIVKKNVDSEQIHHLLKVIDLFDFKDK